MEIQHPQFTDRRTQGHIKCMANDEETEDNRFSLWRLRSAVS